MPGTDSEEYNPSLDGGLRRHRGALVAGLAGVLAVAIGAALGGGFLFWADSKVDRLDVDGIRPIGEPGERLVDADDPPLDLEDVVNVLVVGSDAREGLTREQRRALGTGDADGDRTDTIMLVRLDPRHDTVSLLSFPRDLLVTRCDGSRGRINAAYQVGEDTGVGGPSCLVHTISDFSGLPVHHYVQVDFPGFIELVDLTDGVTVYLEHPIDDWRANLDLPAGCNRLDGVTALGFVRHRASDSDYGRVARQQRLVKELINEATRLGNLLNLPRALRMVETAAEAVQTDQDLSLDMMRRIAFTFRDLDASNVAARTVPGDFQMIDGVAFEVPIEDKAEQLFAAFQSGMLHLEDAEEAEDVEEAEVATGAAVELTPEDVPPIMVLNGAGTDGLASQAQTQLEAEGFHVAGIDNADEFDRDTTQIRHPADLADKAEVVAAHLVAAELVAVDDADGIVVVLGRDYELRPAVTEVADDDDEPPIEGGIDVEDIDEAPEPPDRIGEFVGAQAPPDFCYE